MLSEHKKVFLLRCKDSSAVSVLAMKTHGFIDPGGIDLPLIRLLDIDAFYPLSVQPIFVTITVALE